MKLYYYLLILWYRKSDILLYLLPWDLQVLGIKTYFSKKKMVNLKNP